VVSLLWYPKPVIGSSKIHRWMTIPHVAIVAGLLLGANNPNTLEGIVGKKYSEGKPYIGIFELSYASSYKTEWM
jgi:hypothetical protein